MSVEKREILDENQNIIEKKLPFCNVIDLTGGEDEIDEEPAKKRVVLSSITNLKSPEAKKPVVQKSDYLKIIIDHLPYSDQPGPSGLLLRRQRKNPRSTEGCVNCAAKTLSSIVLNCGHRFCYHCFKKTLEDDTTIENACPFLNCNYVISDAEIKDYLIEIPADYISYLEHSRNMLRKALKIRDLEMNFLGAKSGSQLSSRDEIIMIQDADISTQHRRLQDLDNMSYIKNITVFECPICFAEIEIGQGVMLKNCLHSLCLECFREHVKRSDDPEVICPFNSFEGSCEFLIQEREIRAICDQSIIEIHLSKALKRAEAVLDNVYHCKTPDCVGFIQHEGSKAFCCDVCDKVNCINCKTVHEDKTCEQYQSDLKNNEKNQQDMKLTEAAVKNMIEAGDAMKCPKCDTLIQKQDGCDFIMCAVCKLGICFVTKKPRMPMTKVINGVSFTIKGCDCNKKNLLGKFVKCHPKCRNCH